MGQEKGKAPTIYDVARRAGVSHQTVSRFLRGYEGIRPATRERVTCALQELGYRTNMMARNLRQGKSGIVTLAIPTLRQSYFAELAQAVIDAASSVGLTVFVETTGGDRRCELAVLQRFYGNFADGVIFLPLTITPADLDGEGVQFPLVLLGDQVAFGGYDHVVMANEAGATLAVRHLVARGRRRIAVIGVEPLENSGAAWWRYRGYRRALEEEGIPFDERLVARPPARGWVRSAGLAAMERLLESGVSFDAVFGFNDAIALGALRALLHAGVRVPEDVAVIGFDGTQDGLYSTPTLSSVSPHRDLIAELAVKTLKERIDGGSGEHSRQIQTGIELIARESTDVISLPREGGG